MAPGFRHAYGLEGSPAKYANYFEVGHNAYEFLIDFGHDEGIDGRGAERHTRIVTNPASARNLLDLLQRSVEQHERRYGNRPERPSGT